MPRTKPELTLPQRRALHWALSAARHEVYTGSLPEKSVQLLAEKGYIIEDWRYPPERRARMQEEKDTHIAEAHSLLNQWVSMPAEVSARDAFWQQAAKLLARASEAHWHLYDLRCFLTEAGVAFARQDTPFTPGKDA